VQLLGPGAVAAAYHGAPPYRLPSAVQHTSGTEAHDPIEQIFFFAQILSGHLFFIPEVDGHFIFYFLIIII
jgi:hypothetical protein